MAGPAWNALKAQADRDPGTPNLANQDSLHDVYVLAKALVYARTNDEGYRADVYSNLIRTIGTEAGTRSLALGRNLASYVISADLIDLPAYDPTFDAATFRPWLSYLLTRRNADGRTLQQCHEQRPNNWGTMCGASRAAVAVYLDDQAELARTAQVFHGFVGNRSAYAGFSYGELSWQCDPARPVGINPAGCMKEGHSIDGVIPDDMRRGASFRWPPVRTGYVWESLQGAIVQAEILSRAGYDAWNWEDYALYRAVQLLYELDGQFGGWYATGDDQWQPWLVNYAYGAGFPAATPARPGKNMGWTDWTHVR